MDPTTYWCNVKLNLSRFMTFRHKFLLHTMKKRRWYRTNRVQMFHRLSCRVFNITYFKSQQFLNRLFNSNITKTTHLDLWPKWIRCSSLQDTYLLRTGHSWTGCSAGPSCSPPPSSFLREISASFDSVYIISEIFQTLRLSGTSRCIILTRPKWKKTKLSPSCVKDKCCTVSFRTP